jgi:carbon-monoxide dehydrogenase small subunit
VTTIEGLDADEIAGELRDAFKREHTLQCGYCTPGMLVSARDIVLRLDAPSERDIRVALSGNLCRCTGYVGIVRATASVLAARRARGVAAAPDGGRRRLGPAGSGASGAVVAASPAASVRAAPPPRPTSLPADFTPQATFSRSLTVAHPPEAVWAFFGRVADVASCLPGASLDEGGDGPEVAGRMRVKVGPIRAEFRGRARISRDEAARTGEIVGAGEDAGSRTRTAGRVRYAVKPGDSAASARVDLEIGYTLAGGLAQFSRGGLVEDVADRLTAAFAANLDARLAGAPSSEAARELDAGSLAFGALASWLRRLLAGLFKRSSA